MGLSAPSIAITVVTCFLVAAVIVVLVGFIILTLVDVLRRRRPLSPLEQLDADYRAARRAMNEAPGQSWRNLID